jgi:hypothetical protein
MLTAAGGLGKHFCSATQLVFHCGGYTTGTSGSPLLAYLHAATGLGTVIGVIGGYQQGGMTDAISYAAVLGPYIASLYQAAIAGPWAPAGPARRPGAGRVDPARPADQTTARNDPVHRGNSHPNAAVMQMIPSDPVHRWSTGD